MTSRRESRHAWPFLCAVALAPPAASWYIWRCNSFTFLGVLIPQFRERCCPSYAVFVLPSLASLGQRERRSRVLSSLEGFCYEATGIPDCTLITLELTVLFHWPQQSYFFISCSPMSYSIISFKSSRKNIQFHTGKIIDLVQLFRIFNNSGHFYHLDFEHENDLIHDWYFFDSNRWPY